MAGSDSSRMGLTATVSQRAIGRVSVWIIGVAVAVFVSSHAATWIVANLTTRILWTVSTMFQKTAVAQTLHDVQQQRSGTAVPHASVRRRLPLTIERNKI
jgi:hypothetical protein